MAGFSYPRRVVRKPHKGLNKLSEIVSKAATTSNSTPSNLSKKIVKPTDTIPIEINSIKDEIEK